MVLKHVIFVKMKNLKDLNSFQNLNSSKRYYVRAVTNTHINKHFHALTVTIVIQTW